MTKLLETFGTSVSLVAEQKSYTALSRTLERIPAVGIQHGNGYNLVSKDKRPTMPGRIWQHECDDWYIYSNISNGTKAEDLKRISDHYHLGLKIEEGKP